MPASGRHYPSPPVVPAAGRQPSGSGRDALFQRRVIGEADRSTTEEGRTIRRIQFRPQSQALRQIRVGDERPAEANQVSPAFGQCLLGTLGGVLAGVDQRTG